MKKILLFTLVLFAFIPLKGVGQWRVLHTFHSPDSINNGFSNLRISSLYFLDLPGPPRIGFIGLTTSSVTDTTPNSGGEVWKTTDGGLTWGQIGPINDRTFFAKGVFDFAFKDTLTGWLAAMGTGGACYKTTDGGATWARLPGTDGECYSIYYHEATRILFLSISRDKFGLSSSDEGASWQSLNLTFTSCAFSDALVGMLAGSGVWGGIDYGPNSNTIDGGRTWTQLSIDRWSARLLPIKGSKTFFCLCDSGFVYRSDDGGKNWSTVSRLPFPPSFPAYPLSHIYSLYGDIQHIYTQTRGGVLVSIDQGVTWQSLCGPSNYMGGANRIGFYQKGSYIYASEVNYGQPAHLWINPTASAAGPRMSIASESSNQSISEPPGGTATFLIRTPKTLPNGFAADSVSVTINFDSDVASHVTDAAAPGWTIRTVRSEQGSVRIKLVKLAGTTLEPDSVIGRIHFRANLAARTSTSIALGEVDWDSDSSYYDCIASLLGSTDSVQLNVTLSCGDSLMLAALRHEPLFEIASLRPNPASRELRIELTHKLDAPVHIGLFDALGAIKKSFESNRTESTLDVSDLPNGVYYLRVSQSGFVQSRKVVISR
ncbi:MAG: T9SS type A sorting domain-containing protein [Candidatus Kapaibacterium sp.]|jgi:hypothetical protein